MAAVASNATVGHAAATTKPSCSAPAASSTSTTGTTENPVPSITLSITQDDVKRVLEASEALSKKLKEMQQEDDHSKILTVDSGNSSSTEIESKDSTAAKDTPAATEQTHSDASNDDSTGNASLRTAVSTSEDEATKDGSGNVSEQKTTNGNDCKRPLHELIYLAARQCENSMLQSFLDRMKYSGSSTNEIKAGVMVFSEMDLNSKIKRIFDVLGEKRNRTRKGEKENDDEQGKSLSREGALSLFRAVIIAIASCIHKNAKVQIEMGDKEDTEQPRAKRRKPNTPEKDSKKIVSSVDSVPSLDTPTVSFDNSTVATLKDEDPVVETSSVRKEFEEIAVYATDRLVKFAIRKSGSNDKGSSSGSDGVVITFGIFQSWRRAEGARIAPWLDLLNLSRWKTPLRSSERSSTQSQTKNQAQQATKQKPVANPTVPETNPEPEQTKSSSPPIKKSASAESMPIVKKNDSPPKQPPNEPNKKAESVAPVAQPSTQISGHVPSYVNNDSSRTVLSFDFSGSLPEDEGEKAFCITITEENLNTFRGLVERTGLINRSCHEITTILLDASKTREFEGVARKVIPFERFHTCLHQLLGSGSTRRLSKMERDVFSSSFVDFFGCFNSGVPPLESGEAFTHELAVGFCFLCAGNKSSKLATGFEFVEKQSGTGLTSNQLVHFLRSYLTMLAGISFLTSSSDGIMKKKLNSATRKLMYSAVDNGARWTLGHFLKDIGLPEDDSSQRQHTFEAFASWYSNGGFNTAPWLELLDLKKLLALVSVEDANPKSPALAHDSLPAFPGLKSSPPEFLSPRRTHSHHSSNHKKHPHSAPHHASNSAGQHLTPFGHSQPPSAVQVLFTFPLANQCSLVVLKEDATYVRGVVDQLGLLQFPPDEIWATLYSLALKRPPSNRAKKQQKNMTSSKTMLVGKSMFVECMKDTIQQKVKPNKKRSANGHSKSLSDIQDVLSNFFRSFDLVQIDQVSLNELMGGLTLLCGGKKSTKLSFAFSLFDRRQIAKKRGKKSYQKVNSLDGEELFLFLRSFLIVTFSCCRQSWDLSDDAVNRYIAGTANMVSDDVMQYQWRTRKKDRVDFDEFGQWYNEGGYEIAPWLELLDLTKWVLVENFDSLEKHSAPVAPEPSVELEVEDANCPPAPPDEEVDASLFDDDAQNILGSDSFDEMDFLLMQQSSGDKEDAELSKLVKSFPYSPKPSPKAPHPPRTENSLALKFHIVIDDNHEGYMISVSQKRISHLRHVLMESGLHRVECEKASKEILGKSYRDTKSSSRGSTYFLTKDGFDSAMRKVIVSRHMSVDTQRTLSNLLNDIFFAFDYERNGKANAFDIACGFTLLCQGKKSDKLEFAFETLDREKGGYLKRSDLTRYLRSFLLVLVKLTSAKSLDSDFIDDGMTKMNGEKCDNSNNAMSKAVDMGCEWATVQVMEGGRGVRDTITFDDFAEWYTRVGHSNIPWVELLDLNKWIISADVPLSHAR
jgi:Ca2+-binding EF-hand superfamily protein